MLCCCALCEATKIFFGSRSNEKLSLFRFRNFTMLQKQQKAFTQEDIALGLGIKQFYEHGC